MKEYAVLSLAALPAIGSGVSYAPSTPAADGFIGLKTLDGIRVMVVSRGRVAFSAGDRTALVNAGAVFLDVDQAYILVNTTERGQWEGV